jgi:hypothetical protein
VGLKLNGTHQLLLYVDDVNLLSDNIDVIKKNMETLIDAIFTQLPKHMQYIMQPNFVRPVPWFIVNGTQHSSENEIVEAALKSEINRGNTCYVFLSSSIPNKL